MVNLATAFLRTSRWIAKGLVGYLVGGLLNSAAADGLHLQLTYTLSQPQSADQPPPEAFTLYLEVILNKTRQPQLLAVQKRGNLLYVRDEDLRRLGFSLARREGEVNIALDSLPGLVVEYRVNTQQLELTAPLSLLSLPTTRLASTAEQQSPLASASPGLLLNYDIYIHHESDGDQASATTELRVFGLGKGVLSQTALSRAIHRPQGEWNRETVALDTYGEWSFPESAISLRLGDSISGNLPWTRPVRFGGIQLGRNFGLQPYRITTPLTAFVGEATLPSSVELYVNGMRRYQSSVPAGPFELSTAPGITGTGLAHLVVTDILGRATSLDVPFYSTQELLAAGLSDWSASFGWIREDYGLRSFAYDGRPIVRAGLRYGLSNTLTLEANGEVGGNLRNAGVGGVWQAGQAGVISFSHARSAEGGASGNQSTLGYAWSNERWNFSADTQRSYGDYRDIASRYGSAPPDISERMIAGFHAPWLGNLGLSYVRLGYPNSDVRPARYAGAYWSRTVTGRVFLSLSYNQNLDESSDNSLQFGLNFSFDRLHNLSSSWQRDAGRDTLLASLSRSLPGDGGYGWRLQTSGGDTPETAIAEASWLGTHGRMGVGLAHYGERDSSYVQGEGGLIMMNGHLFASRRVDDAFAVVSTSGVPGIPVKLENRPIGQTDENGELLVTRLNAWQRNKISIDPFDLPADMRISAVDQFIVPSNRAGTLAEFSLKNVRAALVDLVDANGQPIPVGSQVEQEGMVEDTTVVGFDGTTYLESLQDHNRLRIRGPGFSCLAVFDYPAAIPGAIPSIGPIPCLKESAP